MLLIPRNTVSGSLGGICPAGHHGMQMSSVSSKELLMERDFTLAYESISGHRPADMI